MQIYSAVISVALRAKGTLSAIVSGRDALPRDPLQVPAMVMSSRFQLLTRILKIDCRLLMPKPIARRKTKKAVAKRFKVTATGKVLRSHAGRRHLLVSKNAKRKRQLAKTAVLDKTDEARIKENLPFN